MRQQIAISEVQKADESVEKLGGLERDSGGLGVCVERFRRPPKTYIFTDLSFPCDSRLGAENWRLLLSEVARQSL